MLQLGAILAPEPCFSGEIGTLRTQATRWGRATSQISNPQPAKSNLHYHHRNIPTGNLHQFHFQLKSLL